MQLLMTEALQHLPTAILPRLIDMFGSTTPNMIAEIRRHADEGNLPSMGLAAHRLKGSCVSLGAEHMADICKQLQHKGETNDAADVATMIDKLEVLYPATFDALKSI